MGGAGRSLRSPPTSPHLVGPSVSSIHGIERILLILIRHDGTSWEERREEHSEAEEVDLKFLSASESIRASILVSGNANLWDAAGTDSRRTWFVLKFSINGAGLCTWAWDRPPLSSWQLCGERCEACINTRCESL